MSKIDEQLKEHATAVGKVVQAYVAEGFTHEDAIKLTCALLSSSQIYIPLPDMIAAGNATIQ